MSSTSIKPLVTTDSTVDNGRIAMRMNNDILIGKMSQFDLTPLFKSIPNLIINLCYKNIFREDSRTNLNCMR